MAAFSLSDYLSERFQTYHTRRLAYDLAEGELHGFCLRRISSPKARISTLLIRFSPREDGIGCCAEMPVTNLKRSDALMRFVDLAAEHIPAGKLFFSGCDIYSSVRLEVGVKLADNDEADVSARINEACDYLEAVMTVLSEPLMGVICGGSPEALAAGCIDHLPAWSGSFTPEILCPAPIPEWMQGLEDEE